jgi:hypothetical protein
MEDGAIQAQLLEYINARRNTLEEYRSGNPRVSRSLIMVLEEELKELEYGFARSDAEIKKVLVDRCGSS